MDFTALIKKSFSFAWNNRVLWIFGFLSAGAGSSGFVNPTGVNWSVPTSFEESGDKVQGVSDVLGASTTYPSVFNADMVVLLAVLIGTVVLLVLLAAVFLTNWSASALVFSILDRNKNRPTFKTGSNAGLKYWVIYLKISLIFVLAILAVIAMLAIPVGLLFLSGMEVFAIISGVAAVIVFILAIFLIAIAGSLVITISQRIAIHKQKGALESIRLAGGLVKKYIGESALTWIIAAGISFGAGFVAILALLPIGAVIAVLYFVNAWLAVIAGIPAFIILFAASGFWNAFLATYWTLFYEHLAAKEGW